MIFKKKNTISLEQAIEDLKQKQKGMSIIGLPYCNNDFYRDILIVNNKQSQKEANMFTKVDYSTPIGVATEDTEEYQEVKITKAYNGWIIKVGCVTFVETDWNKICKALKEYWDDPVKAEKKYYKK